MDDLKLLFRAYVTDALSSGRMEENKVTFPWAKMLLYLNPIVDYSVEMFIFSSHLV